MQSIAVSTNTRRLLLLPLSIHIPRSLPPVLLRGFKAGTAQNTAAAVAAVMSSPPESSASAKDATRERRQAPTHFLCLPLYPQSVAIFSPKPAAEATSSKTPRTSPLQRTAAHDSLKRSLKQLVLDEGESDEGQHGGGGARLGEEDVKIPRDAFRPFGTLHLTLGVMSLRGDEEVRKASDVLQDVDLRRLVREAFSPAPSAAKEAVENLTEEVGGVKLDPEEQGKQDSGSEKLAVTLKGLRTMQSAKKTTVLYSHPSSPTAKGDDEEDAIYRFALSLRDHFISNGLIAPESRRFTLHATIVNTIYSKSSSASSKSKRGGGGGGGWKRGGGRGGRHGKGDKLVIDATDLLDRYHDRVFVEGLEIDRVELCKMGAKKGEEVVDEDGGTEIRGAGYEVVAWKPI